jgi:hypothetical protein
LTCEQVTWTRTPKQTRTDRISDEPEIDIDLNR